MDRRILSNDRSRCRSPRLRFVGSEHRSGPGAERCAAVRLSARLLLPKRVPKLRLPPAFRLPAGGDTKARGTQQRRRARAEEHRWVRRSRAEQRAPREGVAAGRAPVPQPPPAATSTFLRQHRVSRSRSRCARCCGNAAQRRSGTERGGRAGTALPSAGRSPALQQRTAVPGPRTKTALTQQSEGGGRRTGAAAELCRQRIAEGAVMTARGAVRQEGRGSVSWHSAFLSAFQEPADCRLTLCLFTCSRRVQPQRPHPPRSARGSTAAS